PVDCLSNQLVDHRVQIAGLAELSQLPVGARAVLHDCVNVLDLFAAAQLVNNVIDEIEQFQDQVTYRHFLLLAEINQFSVESPANGPPLVLLNQSAPIEPESHVHPIELI